MNKLPQIILFSLLVFLFFFLSEYLMAKWFEDGTPAWKLWAVSLVAAASLVYPLVKKDRPFRATDYVKYRSIRLELSQSLQPDQRVQIQTALAAAGYRIGKKTWSNNGRFQFTSPVSWSTFGETYSILETEDALLIQSRGRFFIDLLDNGESKTRFGEIRDILTRLVD